MKIRNIIIPSSVFLLIGLVGIFIVNLHPLSPEDSNSPRQIWATMSADDNMTLEMGFGIHYNFRETGYTLSDGTQIDPQIILQKMKREKIRWNWDNTFRDELGNELSQQQVLNLLK